jgi:hypothetical protein
MTYQLLNGRFLKIYIYDTEEKKTTATQAIFSKSNLLFGL